MTSAPVTLRPATRRLIGAAEQAAKLSAVLAVLGYVSVRAHFNYLGIWATRPLGVERYLVETYLFAAAVALKLAWIALLLILLAALVLPLRVARDKIRRVTPLTWLGQQNQASSAWLAMLTTVLLAAGAVFLITTLGQHDVLVGPLEVTIVDSRKPWRFDLALLLLLAGSAARVLASARSWLEIDHTRALWSVQLVPLAALAVLVPVLYGEAAHPTQFPMAAIELSGGRPSACGLLVLNSSSDVTIWQAVQGRGRIVVIPASTIASMTVGRLDDALSLGVAAAQNRGVNLPPCEIVTGN